MQPGPRRKTHEAPDLTLQAPNKQKASVGEVNAVLRRILSENGRDHRWSYVVAITCMLLVSGTLMTFAVITSLTFICLLLMIVQAHVPRAGSAGRHTSLRFPID